MSSRRRQRQRQDPDPFADTSPEAVADRGYGTEPLTFKGDQQRVTVRAIDIFSIQPDPMQPRRAIPSPLRGYGREDLFDVWYNLVYQERGDELAVDDLLEGAEVANPALDRRAEPGPLEAAYLQVIDLAASIRRGGLTNPITVAQEGEGYLLETGERRWLAYHLLFASYGADWGKIPARVMAAHDIWRQADENNARENLNAVAKARQFALLMMVLQAEAGHAFQGMDQFEHERHFYTQALAFDAAPYGKRAQLLQGMGAKSPAEMTRCRTILGLPDRVWDMADARNVPQSVLLMVYDLSEDEAYQIVSTWNDSESAPRVGQQKASPTLPADKPTRAAKITQMVQKGLKSAQREAQKADRAGRSAMLDAVQEGIESLQALADYISQLDDLG